MHVHPVFGISVPEHGWVPTPRYLMRRDRILQLMAAMPRGEILEIGPGAGALLHDLRNLGFHCAALEPSGPARALASTIHQAHPIPVHEAPQEEWSGRFHYLLAFEVLEHIKDDFAILCQWREWLAPSGCLLFSVPARQSRWTATDVLAGHYRRYEWHALVQLLERTGYQVERMECYGFPLANLLAMVRSRQHARLAAKHPDKHSDEAKAINTSVSGIERQREGKWYPVLCSRVGSTIMSGFLWMQRLFLTTDIGDGYLVLARRNDHPSR